MQQQYQRQVNNNARFSFWNATFYAIMRNKNVVKSKTQVHSANLDNKVKLRKHKHGLDCDLIA